MPMLDAKQVVVPTLRAELPTSLSTPNLTARRLSTHGGLRKGTQPDRTIQ
jgi:hypothetical protein